MKKSEIIIAIIGSAGLNGIITHILYNSKLKKEQKMRAKTNIWNKIVECLEQVRELELGAKSQEIYNFEEMISGGGYTDFSFDGLRYPSIMSDADTFFSFFTKINEARAQMSQYLDPEVGAYLHYMSGYAFQLMDYLKKNNLAGEYPLTGCFFFQDILAWQNALDTVVVRRLNKSSYKLHSEHGIRWNFAKKKVYMKLWRKTMLFKLIYDIDDSSTSEFKRIFESYMQR